jgi:hypothetical protein
MLRRSIATTSVRTARSGGISIAGVRDGRLQLAIILPPLKASALKELRFEQLFTARAFAWRSHAIIHSRKNNRFR